MPQPDDEPRFLVVVDAISGRVCVGVQLEDLEVFSVCAGSHEEARRKVEAARSAGRKGMSLGSSSRHWRAHVHANFADDPRFVPPTHTVRFALWVGAASEEEARALLAADMAEREDLVSYDLKELQEVTHGDPGVIEVWVD